MDEDKARCLAEAYGVPFSREVYNLIQDAELQGFMYKEKSPFMDGDYGICRPDNG